MEKDTTFKIEKFKKGRDCYRCGCSKSDIRKDKILCGGWGKSYKTHIFKARKLIERPVRDEKMMLTAKNCHAKPFMASVTGCSVRFLDMEGC
jgi:hypothetical protein